MIDTTERARPLPVAALRLGGPSVVLDRLLQAASAGMVLIATAVFIVSLLLARSWLRVPFIGALYDRNLQIVGAGPIGDTQAWALFRQGVHGGQQLSALNGLPVHTSGEVLFALGKSAQGQTITITTRGADGSENATEVRLGALGPQDRTVYIALPAIAAVILLAVSIWAFSTRRKEAAGRALVLLSASLSIVASCYFDLVSTHLLTFVWLLGLILAGAALFELSLLFPKDAPMARRLPMVHWLIFILAFGALAFTLPPSLRVLPPANAYLAIAALAYLAINVLHGLTAYSPIVKMQARILAAATLLSVGPLALWLMLAAAGSKWFSGYLVLPAIILPLTLSYAMLRFSLSGATSWLRQGAVYAFISAVILAAYALIVTGLSLIFGSTPRPASPLWIAVVALSTALLLEPIRRRIQGLANRTFFRGQQAVTDTVQGFANDLSSALSLNAISRVVRQAVQTAIGPAQVHLFVYDELNDQFAALRDETNRPSTDIRFAARGALAEYMSRQRLPLHLDGKSLPANLEPDRSRLGLLNAQLFLSLSRREQSAGWIALGAKSSGEAFSPGDVALLEQLADQASIAINRVQTVENLERRVQEMNALTRVAQGVNITLTFDDVLELIYAQTAQILPLSNFHITLFSPEENYHYLAFVVENKERLTGRENAPLPQNVDLAREVIRRGRPIITQDYEHECKAVGVTPISGGISAWMGVPLSAGAESIGALSVSSREAGFFYTPGQLQVLQAVADQTAGAIVKARLLRETEQRAAQLGKLNDVTRQLAATRETNALRQSVIDGAADLLGCEGGLFYLVDQPTGELIVRAATGSIGPAIIGQHVPAGAGNAARAATSREASTENDLTPGSGAHVLDHGGTGLVPRSSLAVPLQFQESIIGIIEVLNRRDGSPFAPEDQTLLTAFAGQAAVALENVRLYTLTDQELAARVEELSVMQRIDRELNASLEMDRAMRITLEWALRQSNAEAGMIGLLDEGRLRIMAELGYGRALGDTASQSIALTLPGFQTAVDSGLPQRVRFEAGIEGGFLADADHQVVVPIRREATVIGLLVLESTKADVEDLGFLSRLSDHAAIAISNAQLYDEVQRANIAKSDFVSLVAHELKNPMTSIKGYSELLAAGAVGEVNEMQANFLSTIRSNTERMSTLVSDLNDNSKIEAGRLRLDFKAVELPEVVDEIVRSTKRQVEEKKQSIQVELPEKLPPVWADRVRLAQVLTNLVSNSNKYTPEGGLLIIGAEISSNLWDPQGANRVVHIWLRDNGIGITAEDQQRIFQKFFRSEDPKAREAPGAGLGLNITRSLVEMQGGQIWFESEYRQGTTFHFTVPVAEA